MLPKSGFLTEASPALHAMLETLARPVRLGDGETLFSQGDQGDTLYAVISGMLEISVLAEDGRRLALDVMRTGAVFGEIALFDPGPRTASATAQGPTSLLGIRNAEVMGAIARDTALAADLIRLAGLRMRWMSRQISEQAFLGLQPRLARWVLYLSGNDSSLKLSQAHLAEYVGATREAVSKAISTWKRDGIAHSDRDGLRILDRAALQAIALTEPL